MSTPSMTASAPVPATDAASAAPHLRRRLERLVPLVLVMLVFLAAVLSITPWPVGAFVDDAIYTLLAKALATGEGYRMINLPGAPHATHYPPGYPFVLSLLWRLSPEFPDNVVVFKFANAVFLAAAAAGVYWFARRRLEFRVVSAAVIAFVGTATILMLHLAGLVLSEPLFIALLLPALFLVERTVEEGRMRHAIAAGLVLGALSMVRTLGAVAVGGAVVVLLFRRRYAAALGLAAAAALFLVPWQLWLSAYQGETPAILVGKYGAYGPWMMDGYREGGLDFARAVVLKNLVGIGDELGYVLMPLPRWWPRILSLIAAAPLLIGGLVLLARRAPGLAAFLVLYLGVIVIWPFSPYRFLIAIWPLLVLTAFVAVRALWQWATRGNPARSLRLAALAPLAYLVAGHAAYNWVQYRDETWIVLQRRAGESAKPLVEWVARYTQPDDLLSTEHDATVYLYTGRRGVPTSTFLARQRVSPFTPDEHVTWVRTMIETFEPRYFITGFTAHLMAADTLAARTPPVLRRLGAIQNHVVYERITP
ncbi:MAG TPA: glycosyltransferase family 39 protein [Gemmatimonadaceae bacterium]|nr:glycosyltransferase family 39 protein [Gemmatimonadaceae bacterium]